MSEKLLIVEDDKKLNDGIRLALKSDSKQGWHHISFIRCELAGWEWDWFCKRNKEKQSGADYSAYSK